MGLYNLGSVVRDVLERVDSVPTTLSGLPMERIADGKRFMMENWLGVTIGSVNIAEKYQQPLVDFTAAAAMGNMQTLGTDASKFHLGELDIENSGESSINKAMNFFEKQGWDGLKLLGRSVKMFKANG